MTGADNIVGHGYYSLGTPRCLVGPPAGGYIISTNYYYIVLHKADIDMPDAVYISCSDLVVLCQHTAMLPRPLGGTTTSPELIMVPNPKQF